MESNKEIKKRESKIERKKEEKLWRKRDRDRTMVKLREKGNNEKIIFQILYHNFLRDGGRGCLQNNCSSLSFFVVELKL